LNLGSIGFELAQSAMPSWLLQKTL